MLLLLKPVYVHIVCIQYIKKKNETKRSTNKLIYAALDQIITTPPTV
jgi:hypothetical protein